MDVEEGCPFEVQRSECQHSRAHACPGMSVQVHMCTLTRVKCVFVVGEMGFYSDV